MICETMLAACRRLGHRPRDAIRRSLDGSAHERPRHLGRTRLGGQARSRSSSESSPWAGGRALHRHGSGTLNRACSPCSRMRIRSCGFHLYLRGRFPRRGRIPASGLQASSQLAAVKEFLGAHVTVSCWGSFGHSGSYASGGPRSAQSSSIGSRYVGSITSASISQTS